MDRTHHLLARHRKRMHQLASLIVFRSTTPAGALHTRSRCCDSPTPATRCCVVVAPPSWRRQPTRRQQPSFFSATFSSSFFWYSTKSVQYKYYHSSTVNSLQKNLVPRNLQPSPDKKQKPLPSLRTLFTNQLPAITPRDAATRAMRGCVERVARVSDQHFFLFPLSF